MLTSPSVFRQNEQRSGRGRSCNASFIWALFPRYDLSNKCPNPNVKVSLTHAYRSDLMLGDKDLQMMTGSMLCGDKRQSETGVRYGFSARPQAVIWSRTFPTFRTFVDLGVCRRPTNDWNRRISLVAGRPGEGPLSEHHSRHSASAAGTALYAPAGSFGSADGDGSACPIADPNAFRSGRRKTCIVVNLERRHSSTQYHG